MSEKHKVLIILTLDIEDQSELTEAIDKIADLNLPLVVGKSHIAIDEKAAEIEAVLENKP